MNDPELADLCAKLAGRAHGTDVASLRQDLDMLAMAYPPADDVQFERTLAHGVPGEWGETPGAQHDAVVMYLHGGGYVVGSLLSHRHMVAEIGRSARSRTLALDYALAPEYPFPTAVEDVVAAYQFLLSEGIHPGRIAFAGDSAGGGLVVSGLVAIRDAGLPQPSCGWTLSPWVDLECLGHSMSGNAERDPLITKPVLLGLAKYYLNGADPRTPLAAPIHADLEGIAPLMIQVGSNEVLLDDAIRLARVAGAADVSVELQIWPGAPHVWQMFFPDLKAGRRAIESGGTFIRAAMLRETGEA